MIHNKHILKFLATGFYLGVVGAVFLVNINCSAIDFESIDFELLSKKSTTVNESSFLANKIGMFGGTPPDWT